MSKAAHLDFETYSEINIKDSGGFRYAEDPSTEVLILAYAIGDRPVVGIDMTFLDMDMIIRLLSPLFDHIQKGLPVAAHNAQFERRIWEKKLSKILPITPKPLQWDCTAARARALAIPGSLDGAAQAVGLPIQKDPRGKTLIDIFSKPQKSRKRGDDTTWRVLPEHQPDEFEEFIRYCEQDVEVERKLDKILPPLSDVEARAFAMDYDINDRGMPVNMGRVKAAEGFVEEFSQTLMARAEEISGCRPTQIEKTKEFLASRGIKLSNLQAATVEKLAAKKGTPDDVKELVDLRIELSRAGTKKLKAIQNTVSDDGRIRGGFLFSAASTRRWSSTGVQMHNLQKPEGETNPEVVLQLLDSDPYSLVDIFDRPLTALAQSIRGFFEAPEGKTFHIADYASVEPRGLAWMAGEEWMLEAYRNKEDLYRITAARVYGLDHTKLTKDGPERFMGKQLVLGCGYGMGPPRFIETVAKFGTTLTLPESEKAVKGYRNSVPMTIKFWRTVEQACIRAVKNWEPLRVGKLRFRPETLPNGFKVLFVDMPSGTIAYPKPSVGKEEWYGRMRDNFEFYTPLGARWIKTDTFGGSITENIIQALTRDILRDGLLAANDAGFKVVGHVHDEGLAEGDDNEKDLAEFENLLSNSSPWAKGFPIETEGFNSRRYKK